MDRELLEKSALEEVCACMYYELADNMDTTSDAELLKIINHKYKCDNCKE